MRVTAPQPVRATTLATALALALALAALPAHAFQPVSDAQAFTQLIEGRTLTRFGIRLEVSAETAASGRINGRGFGYPVTGAWRWEQGFFCRDLDWGGSDLGYNCQAVLLDGERVRFVSDQGRGDHADFRLR